MSGFVALVAAITGCADDSEIPLDPDADPLYSAVYMGRDDMLPVPRDTLQTGGSIDYAVTIVHQRAVADTLGLESADLSLRLWAQDRLSPSASDVRVLIADSVIPISGLTGTIHVTGTTDAIPSCAGLQFFLFDVRLRNRPPEGGPVTVARDSESARIEEAGPC